MNMRICIVAEHASARYGGEAILPLHYFRFLRSRGIETWLVVHARTQSELTELFPRELNRIHFVKDLWLHKLIFRASKFLPRRLSETTFGLMNQLLTQMIQRKIARRLIRQEKIDVIHQPIPVAPRFPSLLSDLGVPVIIGPLNGGMDYPPAFRGNEPWIGRTGIAIGRLFSDFINLLLPGKKQADVVLVANQRTRQALPAGIRGQVIEMVENGVDIDLWKSLAKSSDHSAVPRFVFVGRLVDWKAVDVVIHALQQVPTAELEIIGDGPMLPAWKSLAKELGIENRVHFRGWLSQKDCALRLQSSTALVLPSLYECGGAVVLEAMAMGKPVIATKWGGPADYLDASCGILIEPESRDSLVHGFAAAMQRLATSPEIAQSMGAAGYALSTRNFDWQRKIDHMTSIYQTLLQRHRTEAN
jgi:glycosyltransferase involved in cell wall biosynthesis